MSFYIIMDINSLQYNLNAGVDHNSFRDQNVLWGPSGFEKSPVQNNLIQQPLYNLTNNNKIQQPSNNYANTVQKNLLANFNRSIFVNTEHKIIAIDSGDRNLSANPNPNQYTILMP